MSGPTMSFPLGCVVKSHAGCKNRGAFCRCALAGEELDPLTEQIEEAIELAAELGDEAFDFTDGRGLYQKRLAIQDAVAALRSLHLASPKVARGFADQLEKAVHHSASTYGGLAVVLDRDTVTALAEWLRPASRV